MSSLNSRIKTLNAKLMINRNFLSSGNSETNLKKNSLNLSIKIYLSIDIQITKILRLEMQFLFKITNK